MRRIRRILLFLALLGALPLSAAQEIVIATQNYTPYVCWINSPTHPGFLVELLRMIYPPPQYKLRIVHQSWEWSRRNLSRGRLHAIIGMTRADAPYLVYPSTPAFTLRYGLYVPVDTPLRRYTGPDDLLRLMRKGFLRNESFTDDLDRFTRDHQKDGSIVFYSSAGDTPRMMRDLLSGYLEAFITTTAAADWAYSRRNDFPETKIVLLTPLGEEQTYWIGFSNQKKESRALAKRFDSEMKRISRTPAYRRLQKKYGLFHP